MTDADHATQKTKPTNATRQLRSAGWMSSVVFFLFAGPMNAAGWVLGWPWGIIGLLSDVTAMVFTVLMPACVLAFTMRNRMRRWQVFTMSQVAKWAWLGLLFASVSGPLFYLLSEVYSGLVDFSNAGEILDFLQSTVLALVFGLTTGVIPFFAVVIGIPCLITAVFVAYLCTEPYIGDSKPVR